MEYGGKRYLLCPMALILSGFAACGTSAAITLRDGSMVSGKIVSSDTDAVYIATANGEKTVPRDRIQDIDHPGNGAGTVGIVLTALGARGMLSLAVGTSKSDGDVFVEVYAPAVLGVSMIAWGFMTYAKSLSASHPFHPKNDHAPSHLIVSPACIFNDKTGSPGLILAQSF